MGFNPTTEPSEDSHNLEVKIRFKMLFRNSLLYQGKELRGGIEFLSAFIRVKNQASCIMALLYLACSPF
jgi:hypothetical protein